jgi:hypothetical protein
MLGGNKLSFSHIALTVGLVLLATVVGSSVKQKFANQEEKDDYEMVKKYLLNDNILYGRNRPKIWIHSKYEVNARKWKNFMSRNSKDLNQPYLYLTVQSIINHCGDDFHICLIDDESFEKLIPTWTIDLSTVPEPMRSRYRQNALLQLVYIYGGMIVPNSFLCLQSLLPIYKQGIAEKTPFMGEELVRLPNTPQSKPFLPGLQFMGAAKEDPLVEKLIGYLQSLEEKQHFQNETEFNYQIHRWCNTQRENGFIRCVEGHIIGTKNTIGKPIILDDLMSEEYLDLEDNSLHGIIIPSAELLRRPKYQYFSILPVDDVLSTNCVLTKYFQISMSKLKSSNTNSLFNNNHKSIVSI